MTRLEEIRARLGVGKETTYYESRSRADIAYLLAEVEAWKTVAERLRVEANTLNDRLCDHHKAAKKVILGDEAPND